MNTWIIPKAQTTPEKFLSSTVRMYEAQNRYGKERPFNYSMAVQQLRGWIYAAVWMNARAIATTPLRLYVRKRGGNKYFRSRALNHRDGRRKSFILGSLKQKPSEYVRNKVAEWGEEFEEVTELHPVLEVLSRPNPWMFGHEFSCVRHMFASLTGNCYLHPILESAAVSGKKVNRVKELWVMPSQFVKVIAATPNTDELIAGYMYGIDASVQQPFAPDEVMHFKLPNPESIWYGLGQMEAAWSTQRLSIAQRETDQAKYDNHARPDLAVITKSANLNIPQLKDLQQEWAQNFRGTFRQGSPVFLTGDTQVIPLNWMPSDQGDKEIITEEIAAVFGVPVSLLKANDPNLASATIGFASWREMTILPYCRMDEEFLNTKLLPIYGIEEDAFLCYDNPVPEDREQVRNDVVAFVGKVWTINEGRAKLGDEPLEDENADKLFVAGGQVALEDAGQPLMAPGSAFDFGGGKPSPRPNPDENKRIKASPPITRQSDHMFTRHKADAADDIREGEREKPILNMQAALNSVFERQRRAVVRACYGRKADVSLDEIVSSLMGFDKQIADAIAPFMAQQLLNGGAQGMLDIDLPADTFTVTNPKVAEFLRGYTIRLAGEINDYTANRLSETLAEGLDKGESSAMLARRVNGLYDDFDGYRSEMIARTESARAFTAGTEQAWRESGIVSGKKWMLAPGACEVCQAVANEFANTQVSLNEPFYPLGSVIRLPSGGIFKVDYTAVMGPPVHPHDRCSIRAVFMKE